MPVPARGLVRQCRAAIVAFGLPVDRFHVVTP